ncbi:hypothetical protein BCEP4_700033 [Burkholderia cepacia]|nr:hypothetical protein BCEP4_700033 [Burkholderia cepacia]
MCGKAASGPVSHCKKLNAGEVQSLEWEQGFLPPQGGYRVRASDTRNFPRAAARDRRGAVFRRTVAGTSAPASA